ncbi:MAG: hypothetical protein JNK77_10325 [Saprospiraceae bacterium]|nr:hypothetical protein [Saprospiraceae bacterium]
MLRIILLLLALIIIVLSLGNWYFEQYYKKDVRLNLSRVSKLQDELLTENDIRRLPPPVQQYLRYAGVLNKPKVHSVKIVFQGRMRGRDKDWFPFVSEQYNFFDVPTRLFFMKGKMFGLNVPGYHAFHNGEASMQIKLFGWFPIVNIKGGVLNKTETVTFFNEMCLLAPATLIDKKIQWELIDSSSAKAIYTNNGITISATLYFDELGRLANFVSDDRSSIDDGKTYRFSTPVHAYKNLHGYNVIARGDGVWHYPEGEFTYGNFILKEVIYNPK